MMEDVDLGSLELREIIAYGPPGGVFRPGDYPWLAAIRVIAKPGDGGASADGNPGEDGRLDMPVIPRSQLTEDLTVTVGRGGKGAAGAQNGQDGSVFIELYAAAEASYSSSSRMGKSAKSLWNSILQGLDQALHPTIRYPNPRYYWRKWRRG